MFNYEAFNRSLIRHSESNDNCTTTKGRLETLITENVNAGERVKMKNTNDTVASAVAAFKTGNYAEAKRIAEKILPENINSAELNAIIGRLLAADKKPSSAVHYLEVAFREKPGEVVGDLLNALQEIGTHAATAKVRHYGEIAHGMWPNNTDFVLLLTHSCGQVGPWEDALKWSRLLIKMAPDHPYANYVAAKSIASTPDFDAEEVLLLLEKSVSLQPDMENDPVIAKDLVDLRATVADARRKQKNLAKKTTIARYPTTGAIDTDIKEVIRKNLVAMYRPPEKIISSDTRFFSMGSCFARNVATALGNKGYSSFHTEV